MNVSIIDDMIVEDTETVILSLNSTDGQAVATDTTTLLIMDNDGMSVRATSTSPSIQHTVLYVHVLLFECHVSIHHIFSQSVGNTLRISQPHVKS